VSQLVPARDLNIRNMYTSWRQPTFCQSRNFSNRSR